MHYFSHVKWFTSEEPSIEVANVNAGEISVVIAAVAAALLSLELIERFLRQRGILNKIDVRLRPLRPWVGTVIRATAGLLLILNGLFGYLYAPNFVNSGSTSDMILAVLLVSIGALFLIGLFTRIAAAALIVTFIVSLFVIDPIEPLDHLEYIGIAAYLLLMGGGHWSLDSRLFKDASWLSRYRDWALPALRIFTGLGLSVLALSEKLLNMSIAQEFLNMHDWNFLASLGVSDRAFIIIAGTVELIVGLSLILNIATRLTTLILAILMIVTAALLGLEEVIGHLFAIGVVLAIWVHDVHPKARYR